MRCPHLTLAALFLLFALSSASAPAHARWPTGCLPDGTEYLAQRLVLLVTPECPALVTGTESALQARTGLPALDRLCSEHGVLRVEPFYPGVLTKPSLRQVTARLYILHLAPGQVLGTAAARLLADPLVQAAEMQTLPRLLYTPDDPFFSLQWHLAHIRAPQAWDHIRGPAAREAVVGVIDTGLDLEHADLAPNLWINEPEDLNHNGRLDPADLNGLDEDGNGFADDVVGWDFADGDNDPSGSHPHCSGVAACVSEATDNGLLGAGVGFSARLMILKSINDHGQLAGGFVAMLYAAETGADVINCSWGVPVPQQYEQAIVSAVWDAGVLIVAAGGEADALIYPAAYDSVLAVSATDQLDRRASFAPFGEYIDICAPGVQILTIWGDDWTILSGTSFASGIVAGVAGLLRAWRPELDNRAIDQLLRDSAVPIDHLNPGFAGLLGAGRIDALAAIVTGIAGDRPIHSAPLQLYASPNPFNATTTIRLSMPRDGWARVTVHDARGRQVALLCEADRVAGNYEMVWRTAEVASGTYFVLARCAQEQVVRKVSLVK